ncbi:hypothetical protein K438DRAFT_1571749, partial [Mycena galopus ATCC 62051]
ISTDDVATKPSDLVRRRCFNCCTTDTSAWRRSVLSINLRPGKVLCDKWSFLAHTHSHPARNKSRICTAHSRALRSAHARPRSNSSRLR